MLWWAVHEKERKATGRLGVKTVEWEDVQSLADREGVDPAMVFRESLQKMVLAHMSHHGFFQHAVFQGGTALRLFYGNPRYSEDLDFVTGNAVGAAPALEDALIGIEDSLANEFLFVESTKLIPQKIQGNLHRFVLRCQGKPLVGALRLNLESMRVPSYDHRLLSLSFPPGNPFVRTETTREILADKVTALALRRFLKGRDVWDLDFLLQSKREQLDPDLVLRKSIDYGEDPHSLPDHLRNGITRLTAHGVSTLEEEMTRFLVPAQYSMIQSTFPSMVRRLAETLETFLVVLQQALSGVKGGLEP